MKKTTKAKLKKYINKAECVRDDFNNIAHGWGKRDAYFIQIKLENSRDALHSDNVSEMLECITDLKQIVEKYSN